MSLMMIPGEKSGGFSKTFAPFSAMMKLYLSFRLILINRSFSVVVLYDQQEGFSDSRSNGIFRIIRTDVTRLVASRILLHFHGSNPRGSENSPEEE